MITVIHAGIYPFDIMLAVDESDESLSNVLTQSGIDIDKYPACFLENDTVKGRCVFFEGNQSLLRLRSIPEDIFEYGVLHHEIFHVCAFILFKVGIPLTQESEEAYAYLIQFITEKIYDILFAEKEEEK